ncbi:putative secreted protein [Ixodes scapularis]
MVLLHALVGALWISIVSTQDNSIPGTEDNSIPGNCDAAENVVLEDRLQRALDQLPRNFVATNTGQIQLIPKIFFLGNTIVQGLMHLRPDRPYRTFCRGQDRVTLFSRNISNNMYRIAASCAVLLVLPYVIHANIIDSSRGECDTLDRDLEFKLNQLFSRLPRTYTETHFGGTKIGNDLLTLGNATITHLNRLEPSNKYQVFCTKDEKRIIANLRSDFLEISYPWRFCSGDKGLISTESPLVGLEVVFLVRETDQGRSIYNIMSRIAASSVVLLVLPYVILGNIIDSSRGDCDTLDRDLELKLNQLFSLLPKTYSDTQFGGTKIGNDLITIGNATITHLNRLEPSSKYQVFCTKDERRIIANLRSDVLEISYPWKVCSGDQGRISTVSPMVGLEVVFLVRETDQGRSIYNIMSRIAASSAVLLVLPYVILGNIIDSSRGDCDTLDRDLELKLNQLFSLLPKAYSDTQFGGTKIGNDLLTIGNATITHLNRLEPSRKYEVFCTRDERRIIANLRSDVLEISYPWKVCSGDQGRISTVSPMVGLEVVFLVRETDQGMLPAAIVSMAVNLFPGPFRYYWVMVMPEFVKRALMDTLAQMQ